VGNEQEAYKRLAGEKAVEYIQDGMTIGLGSGSTVYWMLKKLGEEVKDGLCVQGIPTSIRTMNWAKKFGIPLTDFTKMDTIQVAIDGADEIDPGLNLIKGGGGSLVREKIVATISERLIIIADSSKKVDVLGRHPLPVEVIPFGWEIIAQKYIPDLGGKSTLRKKDNTVFVSDNGNYILDCQFESIADVGSLHAKLKAIVGVVETGLFINMTDTAIIGDENGVSIIDKKENSLHKN